MSATENSEPSTTNTEPASAGGHVRGWPAHLDCVLREEVLPGVACPAAGVPCWRQATSPVVEAIHACTAHGGRT
jgi:hypothetical protein